MFLAQSEYKTRHLISLAAANELATLTDGRLVRLTYWSPEGNKVRVRLPHLTKQWTIKKKQVETIQCSWKVAQEMGLMKSQIGQKGVDFGKTG